MRPLIALLLLCNSVSAGVILLPAKNPDAPGHSMPVPIVQMSVDLEPSPFDRFEINLSPPGMSYAELQLFPASGSADVMLNALTLDGEEVTSIFGVPSEGLWVSALGTEGDTLSSLSVQSLYGQLGSIGGLQVAVPLAIPVTEPHGRSLAAIGMVAVLMLFRSAKN